VDLCAVESCTGIQAPGAARCLAHLPDGDLADFLAGLRPGADLDVSGTTIDEALLSRLIAAVRADGPPTFGAFTADGARFPEAADFRPARFAGEARFHVASFEERALFDDCRFDAAAEFNKVRFTVARFRSADFWGNVTFGSARFDDDASFYGARFHLDVDFDRAAFAGHTNFHDTVVRGTAGFVGADFARPAFFDGMRVEGRADFRQARFHSTADFRGVYVDLDALFADVRFEGGTELGPLEAGRLDLDRSVFEQRVEIVAAAAVVSAERARFAAGVTLRLWYALVNLERAVLGAPSMVVGLERLPQAEIGVAAAAVGRLRRDHQLPSPVAAEDEGFRQPKLVSVKEVDVAGLSVVDVDLEWCRFAGARHLDQLRIEGRSGFGQPPRGVHIGRTWPPVWRWTRRAVLAEERPWRGRQGKAAGWLRQELVDDLIVPPERLIIMYRALRKSLEDSKNEPGAADFYYGEMEMRRHRAHGSDRLVLLMYWLLSGYGLRASRALLAAAVVVAATTTVLILWGMPHPTFELALRTTISAMAFRDPGPSLTAIGVWTVMAARILGTLLLALAVLAVRGRVKR
jgi:uncharacterized protein YjbI with pentapeptide repeats